MYYNCPSKRNSSTITTNALKNFGFVFKTYFLFLKEPRSPFLRKCTVLQNCLNFSILSFSQNDTIRNLKGSNAKFSKYFVPFSLFFSNYAIHTKLNTTATEQPILRINFVKSISELKETNFRCLKMISTANSHKSDKTYVICNRF